MISDQSSSGGSRRGNYQGGQRKGNSLWLFLLGIVVIALAGAGGYKILQLQKLLNESQVLLSTMGNRLQEVTGVVSQTGEVISESDSKFKAELKSINFEIRKLWDLSNKRNKSDITGLQAKSKQYEGQIKTLKDELLTASQVAQKANSQISKLTQELAATSKQLKTIGGEQSINIAALKEELSELSKKMASTKNQLDKISSGESQTSKAIKDVSEGLKSMEVYRQQINRRLIQIEGSIRALQGQQNTKK